jgi:mono/diheme cytochrome c family protein
MRRGGYVAGLVAGALALGGCELKSSGTDLVNGKTQFAQKCGACHTLARAGTTGTAGPNLDEAFAQSRADGLGQSTFKGIVERQILNPNINPQVDPVTEKRITSMPAKLVTGDNARDVAAYVAMAAARPGKDTGKLAAAGVKQAQGTAQAKNGTLDIPIADAGLAYQFKDASAPAGQITIVSKNPQPTDHNIAIDGNGVSVKGNVVQAGGVSKLSIDLKPGTYSFFCSVDAHRQGGMQGKLTVK